MPSPLGHALGGVAAGWFSGGHQVGSRDRRRLWWSGLGFAALGMFPDIDLLFGGHRGPTHGLGSALIAGLAVMVWTRKVRIGVAAAAAYASHTLLDWLASDSSAPVGIMALWPLRRDYYESDAHLFMAISRRYWLAGFVEHNVKAVLWELAVLLPAALLAFVVRTRASASTSAADPCKTNGGASRSHERHEAAKHTKRI